MKPLSCFIASAFGHKEVDAIYLKGVVPVLSVLNIKPIRVDRINHNNNIDDKIIELINKCSFCITDLTFARPSVYYEAGYVEGLQKDVIYICKSDHFSPKESDDYGNFKIHFDLITKNIIPWTSSINNFKKLLKSRVQLITRPLLNQKTKSKRESDSEEEFKRLSTNEKLNLMRSN